MAEDKSSPTNIDIERAWKDEEYRNSLTPEQLARIPTNPAGEAELNEAELDEVTGGGTVTLKPTAQCSKLAQTCFIRGV